MINVVVDNNVLIDFLSEERLNKYPASRRLSECFANQQSNVNFFVSSSSVDNLEFILFHELKRQLSNSNKQILTMIHSAINDLLHRGLRIAKTPTYMEIDYEDIEDAQVIASAIATDAQVVTRDEGMLRKYPGVAITAETFLTQLEDRPGNIDFANLKKQYFQLQPQIEKQMDEVLNSTSFIMGDKVRQLEAELEVFTEASHAITCSSGTDALLLAMMAMEIEPGDEVITTPFTFIATAETIAFLKAVPVFVDIEDETLNIDPRKIEAAITEKTKIIMPVSLYGQSPDLDKINQIAKKHGLKVILDGAQSFGATFKGKMEPQYCDIYTTSFFPAKPLGCYGDGGAVLTNNDEYAEKIKMLRVHGQNKRYHHKYIGMGGRMDTLQAAVILAKLPGYAREIEMRQAVAENYNAIFQSKLSLEQNETLQYGNIRLPEVKKDRTSVWAQYTIRTEKRDAMQKALREKGVPSAVHYPMPLHQQECFQYLHQDNQNYPVAEKASREVISLPMNPFIKEDDIKVIFDAIKN